MDPCDSRGPWACAFSWLPAGISLFAVLSGALFLTWVYTPLEHQESFLNMQQLLARGSLIQSRSSSFSGTWPWAKKTETHTEQTAEGNDGQAREGEQSMAVSCVLSRPCLTAEQSPFLPSPHHCALMDVVRGDRGLCWKGQRGRAFCSQPCRRGC